jgi:phosphohistidine phosphatase SixA
MKLWIMRHCYAGDWSSDPKVERERPLTAEGKATALAIAQTMATCGEVPAVIFSSPFTRATMTADIIGKELKVQVNWIGDLAPMRNLDTTILDLMSFPKARKIMIVAHVDNTTPSMNMLDGDVKWKDLVMGEVRRIKIDRDSGDWALKWALKPSDIGRPDHAK